jgi:hypothetical protein
MLSAVTATSQEKELQRRSCVTIGMCIMLILSFVWFIVALWSNRRHRGLNDDTATSLRVSCFGQRRIIDFLIQRLYVLSTVPTVKIQISRKNARIDLFRKKSVK